MRFVVAFLLIVLSGCSFNPIIQGSSKANGYNKKIDSISVIYLASKLGTESSYISKAEFNKLKDGFDSSGVSTDLFFYSDLDLEGEKKYSYFANKNNYTLIVNPTQRTTGDTQNVTYQLELYDMSLKQKIWVSRLYVSLGWTKGIYQRFDEMGQSIVSRLAQDGLINKPIVAAVK